MIIIIISGITIVICRRHIFHSPGLHTNLWDAIHYINTELLFLCVVLFIFLSRHIPKVPCYSDKCAPFVRPVHPSTAK